MKPILFNIFGLNVYGYGAMIAIGIIAAVMLLSYRARKADYDEDSILNMAILAVILGVAGGKLLYILTEFKSIISYPEQLKDFGSGFVVYGSIIGGALGVYIYCRKKGWGILKIFDLVIPSLPLAQGFGRIGCFLAGCCYGRTTNYFIGVKFKEGSLGPVDTCVYPTQIFSSVFDFALAIFLLWYAKKERKDGRVFSLYLILYSIGRFIIEFIRDDPRGSVGILSTSQFISVFVVFLGVLMFNIDKFKGVFKTGKSKQM
ncbi:prolipoprotein diacylglyceryl transferase [Clostridium sp. YIM B02515]|uniref:Phosphatidylglycerol--prolipoprotein diacylglyceryl transferase n=1 Tax=Clostridium rhizosphaerae TaxID=2803861 RepID=A0ABS1T9N2_9CLOT|nr:prolipoprotein diacylglyceryl transferase [Clostridium rhizosphaerae]MBL4936061.1 prolipoprotein diacylglyceryl transferase [Clostridium rhizosphaerae]